MEQIISFIKIQILNDFFVMSLTIFLVLVIGLVVFFGAKNFLAKKGAKIKRQQKAELSPVARDVFGTKRFGALSILTVFLLAFFVYNLPAKYQLANLIGFNFNNDNVETPAWPVGGQFIASKDTTEENQKWGNQDAMNRVSTGVLGENDQNPGLYAFLNPNQNQTDNLKLGGLLLTKHNELFVVSGTIVSDSIKRHTIKNINLADNAITSRTIKNNSIRSADLNSHLTIEHLAIENELTVSDSITAPELNVDMINLGTNSISDGELTGNWDLGVGNLTTTGIVTATVTGASSLNVLKSGDTMTGNLLFSADNTKDIGASGATRPRTGYFATSVIAPTFTGDLTGNASSATILATARNIFGYSFDGSVALTQIISSLYGGTGNGFTKFTGPAGTEKTFTLPDANATLARTDAGQTFSGTQIFSNTISGSITGNSGTVTNGIYDNSTYSDPAWLSTLGGTKISGNISGLSLGISGTMAFSQLTNPGANTNLAMASYTTTFTYGATTGASNLFNLTDSSGNTGTGILLNVTTADTSLLKPFQVSALNGLFPAIAVNNSGQVGVGTNNPYSQLSVVGGATFGATYSITTLTDGKVAIENNLSIGTTTPLAMLDVNGVGAHGLGTVSAPSFAFRTDLNTGMWSSGADTINFSVAGVEKLRIQSDGNVGIGTTAPNSKLEVNGDISQTCPTGYVWVPGSAKFGTLPGFCVMKYEAKCDDNADGIGNTTAEDATYKTWHNDSSACTSANNRAVVSSAPGAPIAYISQETARSYCQALGTGYHLINDNEWMTIAENISDTAINDLDSDASLQLGTGQSDNTPGTALATTTGAEPAVSGCDTTKNLEDASNAYSAGSCELRGDGSYAGDDADKGYFGTSNQWATTGYASGTSNKSQMRTAVLSNRKVIWDIPGNVWEWTDNLIIAQEEPEDATPGDEWLEYTAITKFKALSYARPHDDGLASANGIGQLYTQVGTGGTASRAFVRGGLWNIGALSGVFTLLLSYSPTVAYDRIGFRCAR